MANRFATPAQWSLDSITYPIYDYLVAVPEGFAGTSGVFPFKISDGRTPANRLPYAPNTASFTLSTPSSGNVSISNVPLPVTSTDLSLEATQQQVLTSLEQFQFDGLGNLKTAGSGGGGDATAANQITEITAINAVVAKLIAAPSTEAKQDAGNASLASVDAKLPALVAGRIPVELPPGGSGLTDAELRASPVPMSVAALPLPSGASTEATLSTLTGKIPASLTVVGTALKVDGSAVTQPVSGPLTDTQLRASAVPVSLSALPALVASSAVVGKVGIDQTTPGTTNNVEVSKLPKSSSANTPSILTSGGDVISSNTSRKAWGVQNLGTNTLYVRMATGASSSVFHFALAPGSVSDDGRGMSVADDTYTGIVSATGTSPRFVVYEL